MFYSDLLAYQVGYRNTTGLRYKGHYSIWVTNEILDLKMYLQDVLIGGYTGPDIAGWVNGNAYKQTDEVPIGVLPIPKEVREQHQLRDYVKPPEGHGSKRPRHDFLAELQGTRKPILPVHTSRERALFATFMERLPLGNTSKPNWEAMSKEWNDFANQREGVYYKVRRMSRYIYVGKG